MQIVAAACELMYPHLASKILEAAQQASADAALDGAGGGSLWYHLRSPPPAFIPVFLFIGASAVGETLFAALRAICSTIVTVKTVKRLRARVFDSLLAQEVTWFHKVGRDSASLASRISNDCEAVARIVSINFNIALRYGVQAIGALVYLAATNATIAALCFVTTMLMCAISLKCAQNFLPQVNDAYANRYSSSSFFSSNGSRGSMTTSLTIHA